MTILDWVLVAFIGFFFVRGLFRGFLLELTDIVALIGGYFAAKLIAPYLAYFITDNTSLQRGIAGIIAAIVIFLAAAILISLVGKLLRKIVRSASLGWLDRSIGALFGGLKSFFLIVILFFLVGFLPLSKRLTHTIQTGSISGIAWIITDILNEKLKTKPISPVRVFASYLRSLGLNDEVVHIVTDNPELTEKILAKAPEKANLPLDNIMRGEPAAKMPGKVDMPKEVSSGIQEMLENADLSNNEKAEIFWTIIERSSSD